MMTTDYFRNLITEFSQRLGETLGTEDYNDAVADYMDIFRIGARNNFVGAIDPQIPDDVLDSLIADGEFETADEIFRDFAHMIDILKEEFYENLPYWKKTYKTLMESYLERKEMLED